MAPDLWLKVFAVGLCCTCTAMAQTALGRFERQLEQIRRQRQPQLDATLPIDQRVLVDFGGFLSFNVAAIDDIEQFTHVLRQTSLTGYAHVNVDGVHDFFVRGHTTYNDFNSGHDFDGHGDDWVEPTLDRAVYQFDLRRALARYGDRRIEQNLVIRGGRQLVHWANGLVLSQEIDGGLLTLSSSPLTLQLIAGATRRSTTDIDSSRPGFDGDTDRGFYGALLQARVGERHEPFLYGLVQDDRNDNRARSDLVGGTPVTTGFGYDSWYVGVGSTGRLSDNLLYGVELVYQGGDSRSSGFVAVPGGAIPVVQTDEDIEAFALDVRLDYLFDDPRRSRLSGEVLVASGDDDRLHTTNALGGNRTGTDDRAFNAFGLIDTGMAFATNVSNLVMLRAGASTYPFPDSRGVKDLQVGINLFLFQKFDSDAPIDETTSSHDHLGWESDIYVNWRITSDLAVAVRYGVFFPGRAIETDTDERHFLFTGVTLSF